MPFARFHMTLHIILSVICRILGGGACGGGGGGVVIVE